MLGEDEHQDPQSLADKADNLLTRHGFQTSSVVSVDASNSQELAHVAALAPQGRTAMIVPSEGRAVVNEAGARLIRMQRWSQLVSQLQKSLLTQETLPGSRVDSATTTGDRPTRLLVAWPPAYGETIALRAVNHHCT
jgi:hypothetical protein